MKKELLVSLGDSFSSKKWAKLLEDYDYYVKVLARSWRRCRGVRRRQLPHPDVTRADVITLQVGGNDAGFVPVLLLCLWPVGLALHNPAVWYLANRVLSWRMNVMRRRLARLYEAVQSRAKPGARIIVVGYPHLFPESDAARKRMRPFPAVSQLLMRVAASQIDATLAKTTREAGVEYLSVIDHFRGHAAGDDEPWIERVRLWRPGRSLHPNAEGRKQFARLLLARLERGG